MELFTNVENLWLFLFQCRHNVYRRANCNRCSQYALSPWYVYEAFYVITCYKTKVIKMKKNTAHVKIHAIVVVVLVVNA